MKPTLNAVLVGCGGISRAWLNAIKEMPELHIVGLVDLREEAARARAEAYELHDALITTDLDVALDRTHPDIVFDCTIPESHYGVTLTALSHGCHVLGEKPLADTMAHAREMVVAAREAGKLYAVIQNRRYNPNIRRLKAFLESGLIGRITTVTSDFYIGAHFGGFRDRMKHVLLLDMAIHTFDAARMITGADATAVYCKEWNPPGSWYDHDASAIATFDMTDEIVYAYRGSWCAEGLNTTWESAWRIIGEKGSVFWDGGDTFKAQVVKKSGSFFSEWEDLVVPDHGLAAGPSGHAGVISDFVRCVRTGDIPQTIATDNIKSLAMVFGAIESAESGNRIVID